MHPSAPALPALTRSGLVRSRPAGPWGGVAGLLLGLLLSLSLVSLSLLPRGAGAAELLRLDVHRADSGVLLDYEVRLDLSAAVEEALHKGVPLYFEIEASVMRSRWYWRDRRVGGATRSWRLAYQPLTASYRLVSGNASLTLGSLGEALNLVQRGVQWRIADPIRADDGAGHYVDFGFRLDTTQLPRPLQIDVSDRADWNLGIERSVPVPVPR